VQHLAVYQLAGVDAPDDAAQGTLIAGGRTGEAVQVSGDIMKRLLYTYRTPMV
jgi:hypothetical protein